MAGRQVLNYHDVQLYDSDVALFASNQWLNDNTLNFYFQYLYHTLCVPTSHEEVLFMDPAVVSCMMLQCDDDDEYEELGRSLQLATKQICFIPVNDNEGFWADSSHWSLLVYRTATHEFEHYDSSAGHNTSTAKKIAKTFQKLLYHSGNNKDGIEISERKVVNVAESPQQRNGYDCGMYVLVLSEFLCRKYLNESLQLSIHEYVTPDRVTALRLEIPQLIRKLQDEAKQGS